MVANRYLLKDFFHNIIFMKLKTALSHLPHLAVTFPHTTNLSEGSLEMI